jgi:hypothetical protein
MLCTDGASVHPMLKDFSPNRLCWFFRNRQIDRRFPLTKASVHPVLKSLSWCVSVFIQTRHRIDRRCPYSDRRIIRWYRLRYSSSSIHPMQLENTLSVHLTVCVSCASFTQCTKCTDACTDGTVGSSDGVSFLPFLPRF